jgi:membrane fusion protein, heavy metal efflux system
MQACTDAKTAVNNQPQPFCLSDSLLKNVVLDTVASRPVEYELRLSGKISSNEDKLVKVFPLVGGHVEDLKIELGDYVQKGQVMAVIRSSEVADIEQQMTSAQSGLIVARKNLEVSEDMFTTGLISERDVITARKELQLAEGELRKVKEILNIYGIKQSGVYTVKAPISGFVTEKNVTENMQFRSDNLGSLFTISDLDEVWVLANVFESDISKVRVGQPVCVRTLSYPDRQFMGKVDKIFNVLDPASRVMKIRVKIANKDYLLKPEMFAQVNLSYAGDNTMMALKAQDVIFNKNKNYVMVYNDRCNIETREVIASHTTGDITYIEEGLQAGDRVIGRYQLLIYDALNN